MARKQSATEIEHNRRESQTTAERIYDALQRHELTFPQVEERAWQDATPLTYEQRREALACRLVIRSLYLLPREWASATDFAAYL